MKLNPNLALQRIITPEFVTQVIAAARGASALIMRHYQGYVSVEMKEDKSPVTIADTEANHLIVEALTRLSPDILVIAEESGHTHTEDVSAARAFWLVDPLDGTKSFIRKTGEFTVNIGLIDGATKRPVFGVILIPAKNELYFTGADGKAYFQASDDAKPFTISVRKAPADGLTVVASQSHTSKKTEQYVGDLKVKKYIPANSSLKFCMVAKGEADLYPRFGTTMEWDTAAGHALILAAGGTMTNPDGSSFLYGKPGFTNGDFVVRGA